MVVNKDFNSILMDACHQGKYEHLSYWSSVHFFHFRLIIEITISFRTIQHEFIHALGQFHVQSRPDRDQYVTIMWDNIQQGKEHNFKKHDGTLTYNVPYDPKSFMHYSPYGFAIDSSKPTIVSKVKFKF